MVQPNQHPFAESYPAMKRLLHKQPADLRFAVSIGLAVALSRTAYESAAHNFGFVGGLVAAGACGAIVALIIGFVWPSPRKVSPEALAASK